MVFHRTRRTLVLLSPRIRFAGATARVARLLKDARRLDVDASAGATRELVAHDIFCAVVRLVVFHAPGRFPTESRPSRECSAAIRAIRVPTFRFLRARRTRHHRRACGPPDARAVCRTGAKANPLEGSSPLRAAGKTLALTRTKRTNRKPATRGSSIWRISRILVFGFVPRGRG